jgi:hypothetical protein
MKNFFERNGIPVGPRKAIIGAVILVASVVFTFSPLLIAFLSTPPGGNMFSEGGDGGGSAIWLMFMTIPIGFAGTIVGLVITISGVTKTFSFKMVSAEESLEDRNRMQSHRGIALVCLAPVLFLVASIIMLITRQDYTLTADENNQLTRLIIMVLELIYSALVMRLVLKGNNKVISITAGIFLALLVIGFSLLNNLIAVGI